MVLIDFLKAFDLFKNIKSQDDIIPIKPMVIPNPPKMMNTILKISFEAAVIPDI